MPLSGALPPPQAAQATLETATHHLSEPLLATVLKSFQGGVLMSFGGVLSMSLVGGLKSSTKEQYPVLERALQGLAFPVGLVVVYFIGAELFTGYPMWYTMTALHRRGRPMQYVRGAIVCWLGNLLGALAVSGLFCTASGSFASEPFRTGVFDNVRSTIVELQWSQIFIKAIGCGWLVSVAMYLGTQNHDGVSKAIGLHLPFLIATAAKFPHTVEYMFVGSLALFLNIGTAAKLEGFSTWTFLWKCLLPVTLGNTVGGAVGMGFWLWAVYTRENVDKGFDQDFEGENSNGNAERYRDDET